MSDDRKAFNFLSTYWFQLKLLKDDKERLKVFESICQVQFVEKDIEEITFENEMTSILWESMKYNLKKSIDGFKSQKKIDEKLSKIDFDFYIKAWNLLADKHNLTKVIKLTDSRKIKLNARIKESQDFKKLFIQILKCVPNSSFLLGDNKKEWKIYFDWIIENDKNYINILEGKYV